MPFTLNSADRLKGKKAIDELFEKGKSFALAPYRVVYLPATNGAKFGVGVSKKYFKKAVDRNKVKRLTREAYRLQKKIIIDSLPEDAGLSVFFLYTSKEIIAFGDLYKAIEKILVKLSKVAV